MEFFTTYDSDDSEFIATFLNVVNHAANQEATNEKRTRSVIMQDRQAAHDRLVRDYFAADMTRGDIGDPSLILKAVASFDFWIWHAYFGVAGANNDRNVLRQFPIFNDIWTGTAPDMTFTVNGHEYKHGYYLCDGIYPNYATFVKAYSVPRTEKVNKFTERQESARKDVERAFGVLKQKWHVVKYASRLWKEDSMQTIIYACIILHNMMFEFKGRAICKYDENEAVDHGPNFIPGTIEFLTRVAEIENAETCQYLREDLAEHVYQNSVDDVNETE